MTVATVNNRKFSVYVGVDTLTLDGDVSAMTDVDVLKALKTDYPLGVLVRCGDAGPVWIHAGVLLGSAHLDGFGIETMGLVSTACNLIRLCADVDKAVEFGEPAIKRLIMSFVGQARKRCESKKTNQVHAVRFGVASKVVLADRVEPGIVEIDPAGAVAKRLLAAAVKAKALDEDATTDDLEDIYVLVERHPFALPYVARIKLNPDLTPSLTLANRIEFRAVNRGDADGDTLNMFIIPDTEMAISIKLELRATVAHTGMIADSALHVRGVSILEDADTWAENPFSDLKTVEKKMTQSFTMTVDEWLAKHEKMGEYANKYTPFAYRISDIGAAMASLGVDGAREVALLGAVIEEDFYLGLTGGPKTLDIAMETWFKKTMNPKTTIPTVLKGIRDVVRPDLLTTSVKWALFDAAGINQGAFDVHDVKGVFTHMNWLVGKGLTTLGKPRGAAIMDVLGGINAICETDAVKQLGDRFTIKMGVYIAEMLMPILAEKREVTTGDDDWSTGEQTARRDSQDDDMENYA